MRRFLLHVLPIGFHRLRHYGLLANPTRKKNIERRTSAVARPGTPAPLDYHQPQHSAPRAPTFVCRHCGAPMLIIEIFARAQHIRGPPALSARTLNCASTRHGTSTLPPILTHQRRRENPWPSRPDHRLRPIATTRATIRRQSTSLARTHVRSTTVCARSAAVLTPHRQRLNPHKSGNSAR